MQTQVRKCNIMSWLTKKQKAVPVEPCSSSDMDCSQIESTEESSPQIDSQPNLISITAPARKENNPNKIKAAPKSINRREEIKNSADLFEEEVEEGEEEKKSFLSPPVDKFGRSLGDIGYDKSTLYISDKELSAMTPCEEQFWRIKMEYFDTIVFFKKGKFYELFAEDAVLSSELFGLKLTKRGTMKMTGIPEMSLDMWIEKFIYKGYKVAIVDQKETSVSQNMRVKSGEAKQKVIERELKEVVTETTTSSEGIGICSLFVREIDGTEKANVTISVFRPMESEFFVLSFEDDRELFSTQSILKKENIKEIITNASVPFKEKIVRVRPDVWGQNVSPIIEKMGNSGLSLEGEKKEALEILLSYLEYLKYAFTPKLIEYSEKTKNQMQIDGRTIEMLCLVDGPNRKEQSGNSLFRLIDQTRTKQGRRLLRQWIIRPLSCLSKIEKRYATAELLDSVPERDMLESYLQQVGDISDFVKKAKNYKIRAEEIRKLSSSLDAVKSIYAILQSILARSTPNEIEMTCLQVICEKIHTFAVIDEIALGFDISGDIMPLSTDAELISAEKHKKKVVNILEVYGKKESAAAGVEFLVKKIGREHYLECKRTESLLLESKYIPSGSTKTTARYTTAELRKLSETYLEAEEKIAFLAAESVFRISKRISENDICLQDISVGIAALDCLVSFGYISGVKPLFSESLQIKGLVNVGNTHIPNDIDIFPENKLIVLTGPNMAGKSTFLRNVSTAIVLRQIGAKVPASFFSGPIYDRIFTRIGANDNLLEGESTFQIEMKETANILTNATENSFVIIDELGRGTSTKEGSAISMAVKEYLKKIKCTTLYATHFFSAIVEGDITMKMNYKHITNSEEEQEIVYLYKLVDGICSDSCGIDICKMTKVPKEVINRALEIKQIRAKSV
ncbi:DNA mismatch repair protein MutS [Nematocida parisii]|nr:DNA mismatch repair protein MutS [Nematocida parisii]